MTPRQALEHVGVVAFGVLLALTLIAVPSVIVLGAFYLMLG